MSEATIFEFNLPIGFQEGEGETLQKKGRMRLSRAEDEILPLKDYRVQQNPAYLTIILLSRVITQLGDLEGDEVNTHIVENLFSKDFNYLQGMYTRINQKESNVVEVLCPHCEKELDVDLSFTGE